MSGGRELKTPVGSDLTMQTNLDQHEDVRQLLERNTQTTSENARAPQATIHATPRQSPIEKRSLFF